jgi:cell division septum initiation protein DivIVA
LNSISFYHSQIENLAKDNEILQNEIEKLKFEISSFQNQKPENSFQKSEIQNENETEIPFCENGQNGLFSFLKRKSSESKTALETLLKVTSSTPFNNSFLPINLLEWTTDKFFQSKDATGGWMNCELQNNSFSVKSIKLVKRSNCSPEVWELRGSNDSEN